LTTGEEPRGVYLYGVIEISAPVRLETTGLYRAPVRAVPYRDLAAVVSDLPQPELEPTRELALAHERVISFVMRRHPVIPVRFGIVAVPGVPIETVLVGNYELLKNTLERIRDKVELGLKVLWRREAFETDLEGADSRVRQAKAALNEKSGPVSYDEAMQLGQLMAEAADRKRREYIKLLYEPLNQMAAESVLNDILTERMVFNAAFLVPKEKEEDFDRLANQLFVPYAEVLEFRYSGPWPPYNFCRLNLESSLKNPQKVE
jgi:hypothetical protein